MVGSAHRPAQGTPARAAPPCCSTRSARCSFFEPPAPRLRAALRERAGVDVGEEAAGAAMRAEIAYYRAHLHEGRDRGGSPALRRGAARRRCGRAAAGRRGARAAVLTAALLDALRVPRLPRGARRAAPRCATAASRSSSSPTGTSRCTSGSPRRASRRCSTGRWPRRSSAPPSRSRDLRARARARGRRGRERRGTWGTRRRPTSRARWPRGCGPCSSPATGPSRRRRACR